MVDCLCDLDRLDEIVVRLVRAHLAGPFRVDNGVDYHVTYVHPRGADFAGDRFGKDTLGGLVWRKARKAIIQFSTGGRGRDPSARGSARDLRPDMASLSTGSVNFPTIIYENSAALVTDLVNQLFRHDCQPSRALAAQARWPVGYSGFCWDRSASVLPSLRFLDTNSFAAEFIPDLLGFFRSDLQRLEDGFCLGELDVAIFHDFDPVAPRVTDF